MADENEHVKNLEKALGSLIDRRRQIAIGLSEPFKRGRTENLQERFNVVQTTIEAVRKAIDEKNTSLKRESRSCLRLPEWRDARSSPGAFKFAPGREAGRSPGAIADQVRDGRKPQDRHGARRCGTAIDYAAGG